MKVFTEAISDLKDPERYFDKYYKSFDFSEEEPVSKVSGYDYIGKERFLTPVGIVHVKQLPTYIKLAWCLKNAPMEMFDGNSCSAPELEKILLLDYGNLVLNQGTMFSYTFPVNVEVLGFGHIKTSTELAFAIRRIS